MADDLGILEVLKNKGILTQEEYDRILERDKMKRDGERDQVKTQAAAATKDTLQPTGKDEVKGTFRNGFTFETADKKNTISLRGRVELDYRSFAGPTAEDADTFDLRRAYLAVEGKLYDYYEYRVRANFSTLNGPTTTVCTQVGPTSGIDPTPRCTQTAAVANVSNTNLDEAWINVNWWKFAQLKFGQFKMPFSLEQMTKDIFVDFTERSMGDAISPGKERGVQLWGYPNQDVTYALAYSNGQGINANDTNNVVDDKTILTRLTVNIPGLFGNRKLIGHLGGSYASGNIPVAAAVSGRTEARGITFFTPNAFTGNDADRTRYGAEGALASGPVKLQSEFMRASYAGQSAAVGSAVATAFDKSIDTYYVNLAWLITGEHYADAYRSGVFDRITPSSNFSPKGAGLGAVELALRFSKFDATDFGVTSAALVGSGVIPATSANQAKAWTVGLKWIVNPNVRFLLDYIRTDFSNPVTITNTGQPGVTATVNDERAFTLRAQVDL